ncbi:MAG: DUF898 family protein [Opitutae bacterium]|nr:DUF898 family protein [Opitutae bacterium]MBT7854109.1 DUF898 family protein [Opitutae bacterium]
MNIFIYRDGTPHGPYSLEDIRKYIKGGRIVLEDQAWVQESDGHMQVKNLPGLDDGTLDLLVPIPTSASPDGGGPFLSYIGEGGKFFVLNLVNILLTLVTLGIYSFWAKAKVFKFHWNNTILMNEPLDYHATGKELFIGFLKGILIVFPIGVVIWAIATAVEVPALLTFLAYGFILIILPFLAYAKWKFLLARTSWRNVRMSFTGRLGECYALHLKGLFLTGVTLGIYYPWFRAELDRYLIGNTYYGTEGFQYHGRGDELMPKYLVGILLSVLTCGIYSFWMQADLLRYKWNQTSIQGIRFRNTITGGDLLGYMLLMYLMIYATLGIAFPWAIVMFLKMKASRLAMEQTPDMDAIEVAMRDRSASSLGEGLGEAAEALGDLFGG